MAGVHRGRPLRRAESLLGMLSPARIATLAAIIVIGALTVFALFERDQSGLTRATLHPATAESNWLFTVTAAPPDDSLHAGDTVAIDDPLTLAAYNLYALPVRAPLIVRRIAPPPQVEVDESLKPFPQESFRFVILALQLLFLVVAALVAARGGRTGRDGSLSLAWLLALIPCLMNPTTASWPRPLVLLYAVIGGALAATAFACASDFASRLGGAGDATWAHRYRRVAFGTAAAAGVLSTAVSTDSFLAPATPLVAQQATYTTLLAQALIFVTGLVLAARRARESERQKVLWVAASLAVGVAGFFVTLVLGAAGIREPLRDAPMLSLVAIPLGSAYAILRYRLLDIGFVVNRATVFGVTSLLVLAALALVDFGLQNLLGTWLVRTGLTIQLALALGIGVATRPLHHAVDTFVDDLFFRKRHQAEAALRDLARDLAYIDNSVIVIERSVEAIALQAELRALCYLSSGEAFAFAHSSGGVAVPAAIDRNDQAVVRMLATRTVVDLHAVQTRVDGDFAFPMFARDRLTGFIACGDKVDGVAAYAPDEVRAIADLARAAGVALDLLRVETLERELDALRKTSGGL